jgi:hypothetical protein
MLFTVFILANALNAFFSTPTGVPVSLESRRNSFARFPFIALFFSLLYLIPP